MHRCRSCPGKDGIRSYLEDLSIMHYNTEIRYKQWVYTDRCNLIDVVEPTDEFASSLSSSIYELTVHHYTNIRQNAHLKWLKETLPEDQVIIIGDFPENYSFVA